MAIRSPALQELINDDWLGDGRSTASPSLSYDSTLEPESFENVLYWTTCIIDNKPVINNEESRAFGVTYTSDGIELSVPSSRTCDQVNTAYILTRYASRRQLAGNSLDAILRRSGIGSPDAETEIEAGTKHQGGLVGMLEKINEDVEDGHSGVRGDPGIEEVEIGRDRENTNLASFTTHLLASPLRIQDPKVNGQPQEAASNFTDSGTWDVEPEFETIIEDPLQMTIPSTSNDQTGSMPGPHCSTDQSTTPALVDTTHDIAAGSGPADIADDIVPELRTNQPADQFSSADKKPNVAGTTYQLEGLERCQRCIKQDLECSWTPGTRCGSCKAKTRSCELAKPRCMVDSADLQLLKSSLARIMRIAEKAGLEEIEQKAQECQSSRSLFEFRNHGMRVLQASSESDPEDNLSPI